MKPEVRTALAAATAANSAVAVAYNAAALLEADPTAWALADQAYWLCRAAQDACQNAADALDPCQAEEDDAILYAHFTATNAATNACEAADELVALAEAQNHEIRR